MAMLPVFSESIDYGIYSRIGGRSFLRRCYNFFKVLKRRNLTLIDVFATHCKSRPHKMEIHHGMSSMDRWILGTDRANG
ncbi:hypothetical protein T09_7229 [Trichinella sp. T9]|nr:hypothetical protein T09_7229 [Trichinella sp. T9]